jgi:hypothetical protein
MTPSKTSSEKKRLMFTSSEYFDMLVLYGQCDDTDESATVAAQKYATQFVFPIGNIPAEIL